MERHVYPQTVVSVSSHYKNPNVVVGLLQSGHWRVTCSFHDIAEKFVTCGQITFTHSCHVYQGRCMLCTLYVSYILFVEYLRINFYIWCTHATRSCNILCNLPQFMKSCMTQMLHIDWKGFLLSIECNTMSFVYYTIWKVIM